jgi:ferredoxin/flavodoxin---NADP+ reductase
LSVKTLGKHLVAVIGAGPAGLFAAKKLASPDVHVIIFNRDIKPGGLAEYGIYPTKYKMKAGLRQQFNRILEIPDIDYYGNVIIGLNGDFTLNELRAFGFQAILVTVGAQGTKWLGLQGEDLLGVYHAKDIVYHFNKLPPFSERKFSIGKRVAVVGVGNVMLDIAHWLIREKKVEEVIAVARRGPSEVKFSKKELEYIAANIDLDDLDKEFERVAPVMESVGQDVNEAKEFILSAVPKAVEPISDTRFRFEFLASPSRILGGERGEVRGLEVENTILIKDDGDIKAKRLGIKRVIQVDTVIFCIGDRVDETFGLPVRWNEFVKNPQPQYPVNGLSYEAYNPDSARPIDRVFVAGWAREASSGLVGVARKDGEYGAQAVEQYLQTQPRLKDLNEMLRNIRRKIENLDKPVVSKDDYFYLQQVENEEAARLGLEDFKIATQEDMLEAIKKVGAR